MSFIFCHPDIRLSSKNITCPFLSNWRFFQLSKRKGPGGYEFRTPSTHTVSSTRSPKPPIIFFIPYSLRRIVNVDWKPALFCPCASDPAPVLNASISMDRVTPWKLKSPTTLNDTASRGTIDTDLNVIHGYFSA